MSMRFAPRSFVAALLFAFAFVATPVVARAQTQTPAPGGPDEEEPMPPSIKRPPARSSAFDSSAPSLTLAGPPPKGPVADSFLPSLMGPIGLYRISTAEVGPVNHLRLALHGSYFSTTNFLVKGDSDARVDGSFSFGYTPHEYLEIFGAILTSSNRNRRNSAGETPARRDPELIKSFGDLVLGPKVSVPVSRGMLLGFELGFRFLSSISDLSVSPSSTSLWFGPVYTLDLRPLAHAPLRFHVNANYYLDNSGNLIDFSDPTISKFTREVASFAYDIAGSRLRFGLGMDVPLEQITAPVPLTLFGEYHAEIVTSSAIAAFANEPGDTHNRDQQWFTLGARARVFHGLTADAGVDVRLASFGFQYGTPLAPYNIRFGVSFPLDIDAFTRPTIITRTVERPSNSGPAAAPAALEEPVPGTVKSGRDGKPVGGVMVNVVNRPLGRVATDPDGRFQTPSLPPGPAVLEFTAPGFESQKVTANVQLGHTKKVDVVLTAKVLTGNVRGRVVDGQGHPLQASLRFSGADAFSAQADANGNFSAALPVGPYRVTAEMPQLPPKDVALEITDGHDSQLEIVMKAPNTDVTLTADGIAFKSPIKFKGANAKLDAKMQTALDGVVDILTDHPEIRVLRVEAYWDSSAGAKAKALTEGQAKAIKDYLVKKGIGDGRIEAVGLGAEHPLVPNIGPVNKAKNRRVEFHTSQ
ncbi:MAG TPA: OmpA family protein [Polyangia bacterium]|nr:OmpA family protein [Polyangia bacterium]